MGQPSFLSFPFSGILSGTSPVSGQLSAAVLRHHSMGTFSEEAGSHKQGVAPAQVELREEQWEIGSTLLLE